MSSFLYLFELVTLVGLGWQLVVWWGETNDKNRKYMEATHYAKSAGKPLLIVGGPWGVKPFRYWLKMPAHGNGDVCLDIDHRALRDHPCGVVADVTEIPFSDKSFGAAFASHILEHLKTTGDAKRALGELERVADSIYIVSPSRQSFTAWVKSEHHLWVWQKDNIIYMKQRGSASENGKVEEFNLTQPTFK